MAFDRVGTIPFMDTVGSFLDRLSNAIPPSGAAGWDIDGLQLGDPSDAAITIGVCHEVTDMVVSAVEGDPVDLLISYHPLLFRATTRVTAGRGPSGRAYRLLRAGTALAITHTSFDVVAGGTADSLAAALSLTDVTGFGPNAASSQINVVAFVPSYAVEQVTSAMTAAGAGRIGDYTACSFRSEGIGTFRPGSGTSPVSGIAGEFIQEAETRIEVIASAANQGSVVAALVAEHPYNQPAFHIYSAQSNHGFIGRLGKWDGSLGELGDLVGERLGSSGLRVSGDADHQISSVAVVPGSGAEFISDARESGADVIVTGDVSHHRIVAALDGGVAVIDPGHTPTERPGMAHLVEVVTNVVTDETQVVDLTYADPTPWR